MKTELKRNSTVMKNAKSVQTGDISNRPAARPVLWVRYGSFHAGIEPHSHNLLIAMLLNIVLTHSQKN